MCLNTSHMYSLQFPVTCPVALNTTLNEVVLYNSAKTSTLPITPRSWPEFLTSFNLFSITYLDVFTDFNVIIMCKYVLSQSN